MGSQLTKPYPSDPAKRYRQNRVGQRNEGAVQNGIWSVTVDATGGFLFITIWDAQNRVMRNNQQVTEILANPVGTAGALQTVLEGLVGSGNVSVTGGPGASGGGTPYVIEGIGELAGERFTISTSNALLTGGGATVTATETQVGGRPNASVPIGPDLSTNNANPVNGPAAREA